MEAGAIPIAIAIAADCPRGAASLAAVAVSILEPHPLVSESIQSTRQITAVEAAQSVVASRWHLALRAPGHRLHRKTHILTD